MINVSIALVKESNKRLSSDRTSAPTRKARLSKEMINGMLQRAYERLSR